MPIAAIFAEEAALALASELAPYAAGEAALAASSLLGAEALMGLGAEALGAGAVGGAEALAASEAMAANAASGGAGAGAANINAAQVAAQQNAAMQLANPGITGIPDPNAVASVVAPPPPTTPFTPASVPAPAIAPTSAPYTPLEITNNPANAPFTDYFGTQTAPSPFTPSASPMGIEGQIPANQFVEAGSGGINSLQNTIAQANIPITPPSALEAGMDKAVKFAKANPFTAMTGAYMGANALGLLNPSGATFNNAPYDGPLSRYKLSPNFQGSTANPLDFQYTPIRYAGGGGIMGAGGYDIPVGYDEGGPVALPLPSRTMRSSNAFQVPGQPQDPSQFAAADAYNDILRNRVIADTQTGRANDPMYNVADARQLETRANTPERGFGPMIARNELLKRSNEGEFAAPGYGDLGQFAGSFDPANVPMGDNRYSPVDQYKMIARDASIVGGTAPIMPRDGGRAAMANLTADSNDGRFAVPGYGDLGQFAGSSGGGGGAKPGFDEQGNATMAFAKGGSLSDSISEYQKMLSGQPQAAPAASRDVGIYYDQDPDTRYQDALTAAQIRQSKVNQRAYVSAPAAKRPTPMGKLNLPTSAKSKDSGEVGAASGGIMQSSLGGYAAGGNPRLLKGPGDGMSDNIPATINGRQPARLADGEFVIPADVVSHLGNGSTEAGAKHLHAMMNRVRKARTGNPKQGKQIKPQKYMPK
jgi:hypothetical protein